MKCCTDHLTAPKQQDTSSTDNHPNSSTPHLSLRRRLRRPKVGVHPRHQAEHAARLAPPERRVRCVHLAAVHHCRGYQVGPKVNIKQAGSGHSRSEHVRGGY